MAQRRSVLKAGLAGIAGLSFVPGIGAAEGGVDASKLKEIISTMVPGIAPREFTHDTDQPVIGNRTGDVTIVGFYDYQCPYCRAAHPQLVDWVKGDEKLRLVMKDLPVLGEVSRRSVQLGLGAVGLGLYDEVHMALMTGEQRGKDVAAIDGMLKDQGFDPEELSQSFDKDAVRWMGLIRRNLAEASFFELKGTPSYVVGLNLFRGVTDVKLLDAAVRVVRRGETY